MKEHHGTGDHCKKHHGTGNHCVVCGYRLHKAHHDAIGSLLLGLFQDGEGPRWASEVGGLVPIGATASFPLARRRELLTELRPLEIDFADHPWGGMVTREQRVGKAVTFLDPLPDVLELPC